MADGTITVKNDRVSIGKALIGYRVGLRPEGGLRWRAYFFDCDLGIVEVAGDDIIKEQLARLGDIAVRSSDEEIDEPGDPSVDSSVNQPAA